MSRIPFFAYTVLSRIGQVSNKTPSISKHQNSTSVLRGFWYTLRLLMILDNCKLSDMCPIKSPKNPERVQQIMSNEACQEFRGQTDQQIEAVHNLRMYLNVLSLRSTS